MDEKFVNNATRFLLEAARAVNRKGKLLDELINKFQADVEALDQVTDELFEQVSNQFRKEIFAINNVSDDGDREHELLRNDANDTLSNFFFQDTMDIDSCMAKLNEQLRLIKKD